MLFPFHRLADLFTCLRSRSSGLNKLNATCRPAEAIGLRLGTDHVLHVVKGTLIPLARPPDALIEANLGPVSKQVPGLACVGTCIRHVTGLVGQLSHIGGLTDVLLDDGNELVQAGTAALAKVEDLVGIRPIDGPDDAVNNRRCRCNPEKRSRRQTFAAQRHG